jgi:hypothetical protein
VNAPSPRARGPLWARFAAAFALALGGGIAVALAAVLPLLAGCARPPAPRPAPRLLLVLSEGLSPRELEAFHPAPTRTLAPSVSPLACLASRLSATPVAAHGFRGLSSGCGLDPAVPLWTRALDGAGWRSTALWARPELRRPELGFERAAASAAPDLDPGRRRVEGPDRILAQAAAAPAGELILLHLVRRDFPVIPDLTPTVQRAALAAIDPARLDPAALDPAPGDAADAALQEALREVEQEAQQPEPFAAALVRFGRQPNSPERRVLELWRQELWALALRAELQRWSASWPADAEPLVLLLGLAASAGPPPAALWSSGAPPEGDPQAAFEALQTPLGLARLERGPSGRCEPRVLPLGPDPGLVPLEALAAGLDPTDPGAAAALRAFASALPSAQPLRCQGLGAWIALELGPAGPRWVDRRGLPDRPPELPPDLVLRWPPSAPRVELSLRGLEPEGPLAARLWSPGLGASARLQTTLEPGARLEVWSEREALPLRLSLRDPGGGLVPELALALARGAAPAGWIRCAWLPEADPERAFEGAPAALDLRGGEPASLQPLAGLIGRAGPWPPLERTPERPATGPPWSWPAGRGLWLSEFSAPGATNPLGFGALAPRRDRLEFVLRWPEPAGQALELGAPRAPAGDAAAAQPADEPFLEIRWPRGARLTGLQPTVPWG